MNVNELRSAASILVHNIPDTFWEYRQSELIKHIDQDDPSEFLAWPTIISTMFVGDKSTVRSELAVLRSLSDWPRWEQAIREDDFGKPERLSGETWTSGNLVHQAYHLHRWEQTNGRCIDQLQSIVEIGGGYGAMAKIARRAGFTGKYLICDIPAFALLQEYYLSQLNISVDHLTQPDGKQQADLLIALWSLDEMPIDKSQGWLSSVTADRYLLAMNGAIDLMLLDIDLHKVVWAIDII